VVRPKKSDFKVTTSVEKLGLTLLCPLKSSAATRYITIPPDIIRAYRLFHGDLLKVHLIEARKSREIAEEERETKNESDKN
jgi:hypothetical protein